MAEDALPSADRNRAPTEPLPSIPPLPPRHRPDPHPPSPARRPVPEPPAAKGNAWWTCPPPTAGAGPPRTPHHPRPGLGSGATAPGQRLRVRHHGAQRASGDLGRRRAWTILAVLGSAPLLAALGVVALLPDPPPPPRVATPLPTRPVESSASRSAREPATVTPSATQTRPSGEPADLAQVPAYGATEDLRRAGISVQGSISSAWGWTDGRGRSLVVTVHQVTSQADDGSPTEAGLSAYYLTGLEGSPTVQRKLKDTSLHCSDGGTVVAAFTASAFGVRDLDGDASPEVMIGWTARCGDPGADSRVRLAVMSGSNLYMLRGTGVVIGQAATATGEPPEGPSGDAPAPATVPSSSRWPPALLDAALATFHSAYY
jgi:hypothetical protein